MSFVMCLRKKQTRISDNHKAYGIYGGTGAIILFLLLKLPRAPPHSLPCLILTRRNVTSIAAFNNLGRDQRSRLNPIKSSIEMKSERLPKRSLRLL
ncbi:hypothetical protein BT63DRAFT_426512 [Microthyrium microscopicum]|uniref:Uncharacterized protein n=1 Tax=Microthyrium microscopicum TaxID=703497 RepID=A0A6A6U8M9_9PEZI|nr:hypothetical protein BT63DRAFT_426512 [Microthyrium microscopicum]